MLLALFAASSFASSYAWPVTQSGRSGARPAVRSSVEVEEVAAPTFTDVAEETGLVFSHFLGATGDYFFPEVTVAGTALFDYDGDGDLDVYLLQGCVLHPEKGVEDSLFPLEVPAPPRNRLFRNETIAAEGGGSLRFTDVTDVSGTGHAGYAHGAATADVDNDGDVDLFVTNFGPDVLYRNDGDGTFTDVTAEAGVGDDRWTTSAAFLDYDRDGFLDLFVVAYAEYSIATNKQCERATGEPDYCSPSSYPPAPGRLYRNRGDGTFADVSAEVGIDRVYGHGLGVATGDFDGNGWTDVYVANDGDPNQVWMNHEGELADAGLFSGASVNGAGAPEAGMGIAIGDYDDDGDDDVFVTHLAGETNTLYENLSKGVFVDRTTRAHLGNPSRRMTAFGTAWFDADHDADLDLFVANGAVLFVETLAADPYPYRLPNQLMLQTERGVFVDASASAGPALLLDEVSRGLATGDVDGDGDVDLLVSNANGPIRLLRNDVAHGENWVLLRVVDAELGRDAIGARVRVTLSNGRALHRTVHTDGSYGSASDPRVHVAWPAGVELEQVEVARLGGEFVTVEVRVGAPTRVEIPARSRAGSMEERDAD